MENIKPIFLEEKITKRDYFAGLAMQGMLANGYGEFNNKHKDYIAFLAVEQADELLNQLNKEIKNINCPKCGGDSWKHNSCQTEVKYCKCGASFYI